MLLHVFRFKIRNKRFILEDRIKILLTFEHEEVLGIMMDINLNFYSLLKQLCKKAANKLDQNCPLP